MHRSWFPTLCYRVLLTMKFAQDQSLTFCPAQYSFAPRKPDQNGKLLGTRGKPLFDTWLVLICFRKDVPLRLRLSICHMITPAVRDTVMKYCDASI